jgi:hypothetical protein
MFDRLDLPADLVDHLAEQLSAILLADWDESQRFILATEPSVNCEEAA